MFREGTWKLNVEQSHYPAMMPTIKDHVMVVSYDDGKLLKYTDNFTIGDKTSHVSFDGAYDGKPYKTTNGQDMHVDPERKPAIATSGSTRAARTGIDACDYSRTCHGHDLPQLGFIPPGATKPVTFTEVWNKTK